MKTNIQIAVCLAAGLVATAAFAQTSATSLGHVERADKIYGKEVYSSDNQKVGKLNNLVIDLESGRVLYGIIGTEKGRVAVAPQIFQQTPRAEDEKINASVARQKIESAPKFSDSDKPEELGKADLVSRVYQHFGQSPWWQGSQPASQGSFNNVHKASETIGKKVRNVNNADMGEVENVGIDLPAGRVVYLILEPAAGLDLGDNLYALPPEAFTLGSDKKHLVSSIDKDKLSSAPHFNKDEWAKLSDLSFASSVYQHYGKQPYFNLQPTGR